MLYFISSKLSSSLIDYKKKIEAKHLNITGNSANVFNITKADLDELINIIRTENMFEEKRLIIINNYYLELINSPEDLQNLIKLDKLNLTIIILHKTNGGPTDLEKFVDSQSSNPLIKQIKLPTPTVQSLIHQQLGKKKIANDARQELVKIGNVSLEILSKELEKLSNLSEISLSDVSDFSNLFQDKNYGLALRIINKPLESIAIIKEKCDENFQLFLGLLAWQLRTLIILSSPIKKQQDLLKQYPVKDFVKSNCRPFVGTKFLKRYQNILIDINHLNYLNLQGKIDRDLIWLNLIKVLS